MAAVPVDQAMPELIRFLSTMSLAETHNNRTLPLILELPTEIISMICRYLDDKSLARYRQVCRSLAVKLTLTFGARFFGSIVAILHPISLGILEEISQHPLLSKFFKVVWISTEHKDRGVSVYDIWKCTHILARSLPNLLNLRTVRIDYASFSNCNDIPSSGPWGSARNGFRCGYSILVRSDRCWERCSKTHIDDFTRTYVALSTAFVLSKINEMIDLDISSHPMIQERNSRVSFEHISDRVPEMLRDRVRCIQLCGISPERPTDYDLYERFPGTYDSRLRAYGQHMHAIIDSPMLVGRVVLWPNLSILNIQDIDVAEDTLSGFLAANRATFTEIRFSNMSLAGGTRHQPDGGTGHQHFGVMLLMKLLRTIELKTTTLKTAVHGNSTAGYDYEYHCHKFDRQTTLQLSPEEGIMVALEALCASMPLYRGPLRWGCWTSEMDFTMVEAAVAAKVKFHDGAWKILCEG
jgi:hypothetical protein